MSETSLEDQFLELLKKNEKFRLLVASYLGYDKILSKLEEHDKKFNSILEEIKLLRSEQTKLWENQNKLWESQNKLWEEVRSLREGQNKLWEEVKALREGQTKLWEEVRSLREGQNKLWENQNKLWEEVRSLREGQNKLWEEVRSLREGQNKLWENQNKLWESYDRMYKYMVTGFRDLSRTLGVTFEDHTASLLEIMLKEMGYPDAKVEKKYLVYKDEVIEINLFCEKPLVVGEATISIKSVEEAEKEVEKLLKREKIVEEKYGIKPKLMILSVARATPDISDTLKALAEKYGIKFVLGKEMEEALLL
ncbi:MAG: hypothetical protein ACP5LN_07795 [Thermoproteota archaeon]